MTGSDTLPAPSSAPDALPDDVHALIGLRRPQWERFVIAYVANGGNAARATVAAGYPVRSARQRGSELLRRPEIRAAVDRVRTALAERNRYTLEKLIVDLDEAAQFARETENATALVRARELKGKALGLLVDRIDARVQHVPFRIEIKGVDDDVIDGQAQEVKP